VLSKHIFDDHRLVGCVYVDKVFSQAICMAATLAEAFQGR
jgi:hypothetical protein